MGEKPDINLLPERHLINVNDLRIHETNVKEHPRQQIEDLAQLIKLSGFKDPVVIDKEMKIFAGHGRLEAARLLKLEQVPRSLDHPGSINISLVSYGRRVSLPQFVIGPEYLRSTQSPKKYGKSASV